MKAIVQRVRHNTRIISRIDDRVVFEGGFAGAGLVVLLGWEESDRADLAKLEAREEWIVSRVEGLRVFPDAEGRMNLNLAKYLESTGVTEGGILWVPQFTLAARLESGFRPSFTDALNPEVARARFANLVARLRTRAQPYAHVFGEFGADMELAFTNWGPVTIPLQA
jgi:D-tyrosyl-tRNA(Tyr) deacylase